MCFLLVTFLKGMLTFVCPCFVEVPFHFLFYSFSVLSVWVFPSVPSTWHPSGDAWQWELTGWGCLRQGVPGRTYPPRRREFPAQRAESVLLFQVDSMVKLSSAVAGVSQCDGDYVYRPKGSSRCWEISAPGYPIVRIGCT